ncbi:MAG: hypothetical protein GX607_13870 [Myxococcales bacterium]|jgi:hypothetical protein|nr:hypothetical protein [Myxococcales bacterium]
MPIRSIGLVVLLLGLGGCGADDVVSTAPTCRDVCNRYQDCFDDDFDVTGCTHDCADAAIDDEAFQDRVESCEDCLDRTCVAAAFACPAECAGIVP